MSRKLICVIECDYCREKSNTGLVPTDWQVSKKRFSDGNWMEEKEYHCCTNSSCISQYKLHIESDNLQESEKFN